LEFPGSPPSASIHPAMERERIANPERAGERHPVAFAVVEGHAYVADGESVEMWARFDAAGYLSLDFVVVGTTQLKGSYPVGGERSVVQRIDPILFV
jgi:hypothetical protein